MYSLLDIKKICGKTRQHRQGKWVVQAGRGIAKFNMVDSVGLVEKVEFKQRPEESSSLAIAWT